MLWSLPKALTVTRTPQDLSHPELHKRLPVLFPPLVAEAAAAAAQERPPQLPAAVAGRDGGGQCGAAGALGRLDGGAPDADDAGAELHGGPGAAAVCMHSSARGGRHGAMRRRCTLIALGKWKQCELPADLPEVFVIYTTLNTSP